MNGQSHKLIRLNKLLAESGYGSRREADELIKNGFVKINGVVADTLGIRVDPTVTNLTVDEGALKPKKTVILHKPVGFLSGQPESNCEAPLAVKLLTEANFSSSTPLRSTEPYLLPKMAVAGRLDVNSSGLLVFTQCGMTASRLIGPNSTIEKEYLVRVNNVDKLTEHNNDVLMRLEKLRQGVTCSGDILELHKVSILNEDQLKITLLHGQKHHIRRMLDQVGWKVRTLKRVSIGSVKLGALASGHWRFIRKEESF